LGTVVRGQGTISADNMQYAFLAHLRAGVYAERSLVPCAHPGKPRRLTAQPRRRREARPGLLSPQPARDPPWIERAARSIQLAHPESFCKIVGIIP
jgi:hypothetical protein